jgi:hypothetical protein
MIVAVRKTKRDFFTKAPHIFDLINLALDNYNSIGILQNFETILTIIIPGHDPEK